MICPAEPTLQAVITQNCKSRLRTKATFSQPYGDILSNQLFLNRVVEYIINLTINPDLRFSELDTLPVSTTTITVDGKILTITPGFPGEVTYDSVVLPLDPLRQATITYFEPSIAAQETIVVRLYNTYYTITKVVAGIVFNSQTGITSAV